MADFTQLIKSGKFQTAYLKRWATSNQINENVLLIQGLDRENPDSGTFNRLESDANKLLEEWKAADRELDIYLVKANPEKIMTSSIRLINNLHEINSFCYLWS